MERKALERHGEAAMAALEGSGMPEAPAVLRRRSACAAAAMCTHHSHEYSQRAPPRLTPADARC